MALISFRSHALSQATHQKQVRHHAIGMMQTCSLMSLEIVIVFGCENWNAIMYYI